MISKKLLRGAIISFAILLLYGCESQDNAYKEAKAKDSVESYTEFLKAHPSSKYAKDVKKRIKVLERIEIIKDKVEGNDPVDKTKAIMALRNMEKSDDLTKFVPYLIPALDDSGIVQIVEGVTFFEGVAVVTGKDGGSLRYTSVASEATKTLQYISGEKFGKDPTKWQEWWDENKPKYWKARNGG